MQPAHPFPLDAAQFGIMLFVLAMTFLCGVLGGYFFGMTHAVRHGDSHDSSKSIWTYDDE